jgi:hypothetical protein
LVLTLLVNVKSLHWWCGTCRWRIVWSDCSRTQRPLN